MERDVFTAGMPDSMGRRCKMRANIYEIGRAMDSDGKPIYLNLSNALDRFAANVYSHLSDNIAKCFNFDFSAKIDYVESQDIEKAAKSIKKVFCEKLDAQTVAAAKFANRYYSLFGHRLISDFFVKEVESGRLSDADYNLLRAVTNNGKTKLTENRDLKDKEGNVTQRDESLNISYNDNGRKVSVNYKVEKSDIADSDFATIIAAYKIAAKATNVNGRYDKANKPKIEGVTSAIKRENESLKAQLATLQAQMAQMAALLASQASK